MLRLLPCQRPASPEMKLSPRDTIAVVVEPGLASDERACGIVAASTTASNATTSVLRWSTSRVKTVHGFDVIVNRSFLAPSYVGTERKARDTPCQEVSPAPRNISR